MIVAAKVFENTVCVCIHLDEQPNVGVSLVNEYLPVWRIANCCRRLTSDRPLKSSIFSSKIPPLSESDAVSLLF